MNRTPKQDDGKHFRTPKPKGIETTWQTSPRRKGRLRCDKRAFPRLRPDNCNHHEAKELKRILSKTRGKSQPKKVNNKLETKATAPRLCTNQAPQSLGPTVGHMASLHRPKELASNSQNGWPPQVSLSTSLASAFHVVKTRSVFWRTLCATAADLLPTVP